MSALTKGLTMIANAVILAAMVRIGENLLDKALASMPEGSQPDILKKVIR